MRPSWVGALIGVALLVAGCQGAPATPRETVEIKDRRFIAQDSSGHGHHGVIQGSPELGVPGHRRTAYSFGDSTAWIQVTSTPELNPVRQSFLVGAWVNLEAPPPTGETVSVVRKGLDDSRGGQFELEIDAGGRFRCMVTDSGHNEAVSQSPAVDVADGRWHWVACLRTPQYLTAIVDDELVFTEAATGVVRPDYALAIGSTYGSGSGAGVGRVDEVVYYIARNREPWRREAPPFERRLEHLQQRERAVGIWHLDETGAS